jgi:hypothetical protein
MIEDLDYLANRLLQLAKLTQDLRAENRALQQGLGVRDTQIRHLRDTIAAAQTRVVDVLARLPAAPSEVRESDEAVADQEEVQSQPDDATPTARSVYGTP